MNIIALKRIPGQDNFQLKENDSTVLEIHYRPEMHTARIETRDERRVLIIEDESFLKTKISVKNEYGISIGSLVYDNFSDNHGMVEIENIKFRFFIEHKPTPELQIYKDKKLVYSCHLSFDENNPKEVRYQSSSSVIAVSWYLFLKMSAKQQVASIA